MFALLLLLPVISILLVLYYLCVILTCVFNDIKKMCTQKHYTTVNKALVYAIDPYNGEVTSADITGTFIKRTSRLSKLLRKPLLSKDLNSQTTQYYYLCVSFKCAPSKEEYTCYYDINYSHKTIIFPPYPIDQFEKATSNHRVNAKLVLASETDSNRCCVTYTTVSNVIQPLLGPRDNFFNNSQCGLQINDPFILYVHLYDYVKHLLTSGDHNPEHLNLKVYVPSSDKNFNINLNDVLLWFTHRNTDTK